MIECQGCGAEVLEAEAVASVDELSLLCEGCADDEAGLPFGDAGLWGPDPPPVVKGGQGHEPEDVSRCGWGCLLAAAGIVVAFVLGVVFGGLAATVRP